MPALRKGRDVAGAPDRFPIAFDAIDLDDGTSGGVGHTDLSFAVAPGSIVAVSAPEELCTRLFTLVARFAQPASGSVRFMGRDAATLSGRDVERLRREYLGIVHAVPTLDETSTLEDNIVMAALLAGHRSAQPLVDEALAAAGLSQARSVYPADLSLRELRLADLICALVRPAQLVLVQQGVLDQSPELAEQATALVRAVCTPAERGVLWLTSSVRCACHADRALVYSQGRLVDLDADASSGVKTAR